MVAKRARIWMVFGFYMCESSIMKTGCRVLGRWLLVLVGPCLWGQSESPLYLPETIFPELAQILQHMEKDAPEMLIQRSLVQAAKADERSRLSRKYPQVTLNLQLANRSEFRESSPTFQNTTQPFGIGRVEQDLYHWGALDAFRDIGKFRKAIEDNNYAETYRLLTLRVRVLYLRLLFARAQTRFYDAEVDRLRRVVDRSRQEAADKIITADQVELARIAVEEALVELDGARDEAQMLEEDLRMATGWNGPIDGAGVDLLERLRELEVAEAAMTAQALDGAVAPPSADLKNKQEEVKIEEAEFTRIRSRNLPLFDVVAEAFQDQIATEGRDNENRTVVAVYLRIDWRIFDGFQTQYQKIASKARQRSLEREADRIAAGDRLEIERLKNNRKILEQRISVWKKRVRLSNNAVERALAEQRNNTATETAVMAVRNELLADQLTLASYRLDLLENSSELLSAFGRDPFGEPKTPLDRPVADVFPTNFYW